MLVYLFLLFTVVPLVELALLVWIGGQTAWWVPVAMVLLTGIAGAALARWQGWRAMRRIQDDMQAGRMPAHAVIDGVLILIAGILLVTPGVLSDAVGIALLIPPLRSIVKRVAFNWLRGKITVKATQFTREFQVHGGSDQDASGGEDQIIEAKVISTRVEPGPNATAL